MAEPYQNTKKRNVVPEDLKDFWVVRHGATDLNEICKEEGGVKHWIAQGAGTHVTLNLRGRSEAAAAAKVLKKETIRRIVSSPLARALQTAFSVAAECGWPDITIKNDLMERDFREHEGNLVPLETFIGDYPGCEDWENFKDRVIGALEHARRPGTLLVSHGGPFRIIAEALGVNLPEEDVGNGCVVHFQKSGLGWTGTRLKGPVALISGANGGIGKEIAKELLSRGYRLSLGARDVGKLQKIFGPESWCLHYARFDAADLTTCEQWVASASEKFGRIDALVNNAGCGEHFKLMDKKLEALDRLWSVNTKAPLILTQLCLPYLKKTGAGRIVNIASMSGRRALNEFVGYNMTKAAQRALTQTTHCATWYEGVRAISICPGFVNTDMSAYTDLIEQEEMIQPKDLAQMVREAIERPNTAYTPELQVFCQREPVY